MKLLTATILTLALLAGTGQAAPNLPKNKTTFQLKLRATNHAQQRGITPPRLRCLTKPKLIRCTGTSTTEQPTQTIRCRYTATATPKKTGKRWRTQYRITSRCTTTPKLKLEETDAVTSIGQQGLASFQKNVTIRELKRTSETTFTGFVTWTESSPSDPWGPPLLYCRADFTVERVSVSEVRTLFTDDQCSF